MPKLLMRGSLIAAGLVLSIIGAAALLLTAVESFSPEEAGVILGESVEEVEEPTELIERSVQLMNSLRGEGWRVG